MNLKCIARINGVPKECIIVGFVTMGATVMAIVADCGPQHRGTLYKVELTFVTVTELPEWERTNIKKS